MAPIRRKTPIKSVLNETHSSVLANKQITSSQSLILYLKALISTFIAHDWLGYVIGLLIVFLLDSGVIWYMLNRVKCMSLNFILNFMNVYLDTNIDWTAYMEQVGIYKSGERNYYRIRGDTGPLVYIHLFLSLTITFII